MNLNKCEEYFGFANYILRDGTIVNFVCLGLPDEQNRCLGIQVNENNIPVSSLLHVLHLNDLNRSIIDEVNIYINENL